MTETSEIIKKSRHISILLQPITDFVVNGLLEDFSHTPQGVIIDCTFGGGGHTRQILNTLAKNGLKHCVMGIDQDPEAISRGKVTFEKEILEGRLHLVHGSFDHFDELKESALGKELPIIGLIADLGISSDQIDSEVRGFSFRFNAPLDMRMNHQAGETCYELLQTITEEDLAKLLWTYGEERNSRKIAKRIIQARLQNQLPKTTLELAELVFHCYPPQFRHRRTHPATQTFQALRIAVNHELEQAEELMKRLPLLPQKARIAILTFHSLEDRLIKHSLRNADLYELPSRKAIIPSDTEIEENPRSRSAKLRLAIRK